MFVTGQAQYPVERTLLVTGAIDAVMRSRALNHSVIETPWLADLHYAPPTEPPIRSMRPHPIGASVVPFKEETPTEYTLVPKL